MVQFSELLVLLTLAQGILCYSFHADSAPIALLPTLVDGQVMLPETKKEMPVYLPIPEAGECVKITSRSSLVLLFSFFLFCV